MEYRRHYVLINDRCESCQFIAHAFSLLNLPLTLFPPTDLEKISSLIDCLITCDHLDKKIQQQIYKRLLSPQHILFIGLNHKQEHFHEDKNNYYLLKTPCGLNELLTILSACPDNDHHELNNMELLNPLFGKLVGNSKKIRDTKKMILKVANTNATVLILGQSGSGKDVVASCIHQSSERRDNPFVPINCGAIPSELMESELFGHEKGAFTGAATRRPGRFELANTGTLFLDEIGDMPLAMQIKLLRVIQDRKIDRVGGNHSIDVDVRLIAATHKNLTAMIESGQFREDLLYRVNVFPIQVPSLEERPEDIPAIIEYLLTSIEKRFHHRAVFTDTALNLLCEYPWPGNIRELENFLERMVILYPDKVINVSEIDEHYHTNYQSMEKEVSSDLGPRNISPRKKRVSGLQPVKN
jgi:sigma-54 specific flagellar transcriptional regulator A